MSTSSAFVAVAVCLDVVDLPTCTFSWPPDLRRRTATGDYARSERRLLRKGAQLDDDTNPGRRSAAAKASGRSAIASRSTPTNRPRRTISRSTCGNASRTSTPLAASTASTRPTCAAGSAGGACIPSANRATTAPGPVTSTSTSSKTATSCCGSAATAVRSTSSSCAPWRRSPPSSPATPPTSPTARTSRSTGSRWSTSPRSGGVWRRWACRPPRRAVTPRASCSARRWPVNRSTR